MSHSAVVVIIRTVFWGDAEGRDSGERGEFRVSANWQGKEKEWKWSDAVLNACKE